MSALGFFLCLSGLYASVCIYNMFTEDEIHSQQPIVKSKNIQHVKLSPVPIKLQSIDKSSSKVKLLQYKLENAQYREKLMLLGLWYFGLSAMWNNTRDLANTTQLDSEKLANVVSNEMPWITDNITIDDIHNTNLSSLEINPDITMLGSDMIPPHINVDNLIADNFNGINDAIGSVIDPVIHHSNMVNELYYTDSVLMRDSQYDIINDQSDCNSEYQEDNNLDEMNKMDLQVEPEMDFWPELGFG